MTRTGGTDNQVTVLYNTSNGSATAGTDYTGTSGTLTFAAGVTSQTFIVPILDDGASDSTDQTVNLSLSTPGGGATLASPSAATLTIQEASFGTLAFSTASSSIAEAATTATVTVTRTGGADNQVTVQFSTANGSASAGTDYTGTSGTLTFAAGVASQTFIVPILDDGAGDNTDQTVNLSLSTPGGGASLASPSAATLTIQETSFGTLAFSSASTSIGEAATSATITVTRTGGADNQVTVQFSTANGSASAGTDYTGTSGTLTFAAAVTSQTFIVPILDDGAADNTNQTVNLSLSTPGGGATLASPSSATLTIQEASFGTLAFSTASSSIAEAATTATITVTRTGGADNQVTVQYATSDGSASAGTDYTSTSGTLTLTAGQTSNTFIVPILDDGAGDSTDQTVNLSLSTPGGGASLASPSAATLTIQEINAATLAFSSASSSIAEAATSATITVTRTGGVGNQVTVQFSTANGSASAGTDYTSASGTLTLTAGQTSNTFIVPILDDGAGDNTDQTVNLSLSTPGGGATLGSPSAATLTIHETSFGTLAFSTASTTITEAATGATFTVARVLPTAAPITRRPCSSGHGQRQRPACRFHPDYTGTSGTRHLLTAGQHQQDLHRPHPR